MYCGGSGLDGKVVVAAVARSAAEAAIVEWTPSGLNGAAGRAVVSDSGTLVDMRRWLPFFSIMALDGLVNRQLLRLASLFQRLALASRVKGRVSGRACERRFLP